MENTVKKQKNKLRLPLRAYLMYFLLATLLFTGVSFSKFTTTSSGQASARVAVMAANSSYTLDVAQIVLAPGEFEVFVVELTNEDESGRVCEVVQEYSMTVENITGNMDLQFTYYSDEELTEPIQQVSGMFYAGTVDTDTFWVKVSWPGPQSEHYSYAVDALRINVVAQQLDSVN